MDQHTANNCKRLCPEFSYLTTSENLLSTEVPTTTTRGQNQYLRVTVLMLSAFLVLSLLFGLIMFVLFCFRKSLMRCWRIVLRIRTGSNVVKEKMPIQVTEDVTSTTPLSPNTGQTVLQSQQTETIE
ncbi:hypothetical protein LSH36_275g01006 [Paralvinella palmiformis]|uniref:Uncharacterized protein n=1 Tax=Paralvinella palmiformis TaxID=53620 RepID=A0AAD9JK21_9ANNE|nr:hypothetical protein LSH36_275g01006 [Paralvinella palmiformis]